MPIDPNVALQAMERSLGMVPGVVVVVVLLGGPTVLWLLYRFVVQPRAGRYESGSQELLWVCSDCRSVNEARHSRCYGCGLSRDAITGALQVFDGDGLVTLEGEDDWDDAPLDDDDGWFETPGIPDFVPATALGDRPTLPAPEPPGPPPVVPTKPRRLVAVGPGRTRAAPSMSPIPSATPSDVPPADAPPTPSPSPAPSMPSSARAPRRRPQVAAGSARPSSADTTADPPAGA